MFCYVLISVDLPIKSRLTPLAMGNYMNAPMTVKEHIDGLVQDCSNSIANALELPQCCIKPLTLSL